VFCTLMMAHWTETRLVFSTYFNSYFIMI
jgi:hypothetical protein